MDWRVISTRREASMSYTCPCPRRRQRRRARCRGHFTDGEGSARTGRLFHRRRGGFMDGNGMLDGRTIGRKRSRSFGWRRKSTRRTEEEAVGRRAGTWQKGTREEKSMGDGREGGESERRGRKGERGDETRSSFSTARCGLFSLAHS
eukprot:3555209-Rhodomonas_salina.1